MSQNQGQRARDGHDGYAWVVQRVGELNDGPVVDLIDPATGAWRKNVPVMVLGGGGGNYLYMAPAVGSQVITLTMPRGAMVVLGGLLEPQGGANLKESPEGYQSDRDRDDTAPASGYTIRLGGASIYIDPTGDITISPAAGRDLNLQYSGFFRLSDGQSPGYLPEAGALANELGKIVDRLNELDRRFTLHEGQPADTAHVSPQAFLNAPNPLEGFVDVSVDSSSFTVRSVKVPSGG